MTEPTLEEQIEHQENLCRVRKENAEILGAQIPDSQEAILASLKELQSIRSAEMPVEPESVKANREAVKKYGVSSGIIEYIDRLQSALQVAQQEKADALERGDQWETTATNLLTRAEKAESELAAIRSAELPVEPEIVKQDRIDNVSGTFRDTRLKYIDALKLCIQKEKERADCAERDDSQKAEANRELWQRTEKAEDELAALRRRLMEPDEEMLEAGKNCFLSGGYVRELFKAMCAVALKEGK